MKFTVSTDSFKFESDDLQLAKSFLEFMELEDSGALSDGSKLREFFNQSPEDSTKPLDIPDNMPKDLYDLLVENDALERYINNFNLIIANKYKVQRTSSPITSLSDFLSRDITQLLGGLSWELCSAFNWTSAPEGLPFWEDLSNKLKSKRAV